MTTRKTRPNCTFSTQLPLKSLTNDNSTLLFSNVTEQDILLRKEFEDLTKRKPDQFKVIFTLDKPPAGWKGPTGFLTADVLGKNLPPAGMADKIKIFVCG